MVTQKIIQGRKCPYCNEVYMEHITAEECAEECLLKEIDEPIEYFGSPEWTCDYCGKEYIGEQNADECEKVHRKAKDKYYEDYKQKESMELLAKAAAHPEQTKFVKERKK